MMSSFAARLSDSIASIPPMHAATLLPFITMLILWTGLTSAGWSHELTFVLVLVIAQAHLLWRNLPQAAFTLGKVSSGHVRLLSWPVLFMLGLAALQLIVADPLFTQRLVSAGCLFVLVVMLLGARHEQAIMARLMQTMRSDKPFSTPVSLLRVNAVFAAAMLCVNELLIASGSLTVWLTASTFLIVVLRAAYWFVILLLIPPTGQPEDKAA